MLITDILEVYIKLFEFIFEKINLKFRGIRIGPLVFDLKKRADLKYEGTMQKINDATQHLQDAILTIGNMKTEIIEKKKELDAVIVVINSKRQQKASIDEESELAKTLLEEDREKLSEVLGLSEIKTSRIGKFAGFFAGILASIVAAGIIALISLLF